MDLSQLVLHSLSFAHPDAGHPLHLLLGAPDPPTRSRIKQTLRGLAYQGLVEYDNYSDDNIRLMPLGRVVSALPTPPRIGRMLFMGLVLRAIGPALEIAALLSVPKLFSSEFITEKPHCSDVVRLLEEYREYVKLDEWQQADHPEGKLFEQVSRIRNQLEKYMLSFIRRKAKASTVKEVMDGALWNENQERVAALVALVCTATPHIAHLVQNKSGCGFSTRDVAERARMHPSSVNFESDRRVHWYVYNELRATKLPYLHATTAVSPLDLALFADASDVKTGAGDDDEWEGPQFEEEETDGSVDWLFVVDQWVPVDVSDPSQRETFLNLRKLFMDEMLQQVARDPARVLSSPEYKRIVLFALSALEHQRLNMKHLELTREVHVKHHPQKGKGEHGERSYGRGSLE
jgi:HrpA-like RNA helicase